MSTITRAPSRRPGDRPSERAWPAAAAVLAASAGLAAILATAAGRPWDGGPPAAGAASAAAMPFGPPPLLFVENRGQIDTPPGAPAAFYADSRDLRFAFGARGVAITVIGPPEGPPPPPRRRPGVAVTGLREEVDPRTGVARWVGAPRRVEPPPRPRHTVFLDFVGASSAARPVGRDRAPTVVSFFRGPRAEWKTAIPTYRQVAYLDLWPGIDLVYTAEAGEVKQTFVVRPGADPDRIRLAWRGATGVAADAAGALVVTTPAGSFTDAPPVAYQPSGGKRAPVAAAYAVGPGASRASIPYAFTLAPHDPALPLVIDPAIFIYGGFFGGPDANRGLGIAVDDAGSAYFCGETNTDRGGRDAYAVKVSADGTRYDYIAYVGGRASDTCFDIGVDAAGNAYLTGVAASSVAAGFPATVGPDLTHNGGGDDTLVVKLDPTGTDLVYAGYLGGSGFDFGEGIRVAADGTAYLSGIAGSSQTTFPATVGPDVTHNGGYDAYVCKLRPVPDAPDPEDNYAWCGYVGGSAEDVGVFRGNDGSVGITAGHLAFDAAGNVYASGMTRSPGTSFPDGDGFGALTSADNTHNGGWDAWAVKVKADGSGLAYAGYLGGSGQDEGYGAGVDAAGAFYFTGGTQSRTSFPAVVGPDLTFNGGISDGFVAKVAPDGSRYVYAGFIGGECTGDCGPDSDELGVGLTADADGHAYPIGWTYGTGTTFPAVGGPDLTPNGPHVSLFLDDGASGDAWVGRVKPVPDAADVLGNYDFVGFVGGDKWDAAFWAALDPRGGLYVAGDTGSGATTFPNGAGLGPFASPRTTRAGAYDAFVVKVAYDAAGPTLTPEPTRGPEPTAGSTATPVGRGFLPWSRRD